MTEATDLRPFDPATSMATLDDVVAHLDAAFEDGDPRVIAEMIGAAARSKGMSAVARGAGLSRESLYRALGPDGNPTLTTTVAVLGALGLRLAVQPARVAAEA
jgi:probable addiction module antidote protein